MGSDSVYKRLGLNEVEVWLDNDRTSFQDFNGLFQCNGLLMFRRTFQSEDSCTELGPDIDMSGR
jgi:hypothetical protein